METAPKQGWFRRNSVTILTTLGLLFSSSVAGVVGWASWQHIVEVGRSAGEGSADLLPVAIDGLMLTGTVMGAVDRIRGFRTRGWAVLALWTGSILTLAFNMLSAWGRGPKAMLIAVLFAVTLLIAVETMFHPSQRPLTKTAKRIKEVVSNAVAESAPILAPITPPETVVIPEPVAKPEPKPAGKPGRKPGPQNQPRKRPGGRPRYMGGAGGPSTTDAAPKGTEPVKVEESRREEVSIEPIMDDLKENPVAMGETLVEMVGEGSGRS